MAFRWPWSTSKAQPRASVQQGSGVLINTSQELEEYLKAGDMSRSGAAVTPSTAMRVAAVYACVRIIAGAVATLPLHVKRRVDDRTREDASDLPLWSLMRRRPNGWQKPHQFRRMLQTHVLLRGNAYCHIVRSRGRIIELIPLDPERVDVRQGATLEIVYRYHRKDGSVVEFRQDEIFHLYGLTLDGIQGVTPITYARETIGLALAQEDHGATTFRNGARVAGVLEHPEQLGNEGKDNLKSSLDEYRSGGASEGKFLILEEGMSFKQMAMTAVDSQWIESRRFTRSDIAMFFGVPPHMIGDTEKSTSWGSGIEQQKDGFVTFTLDDHLTMWEEGITVDLAPTEDVYAKFNRNALVKGNIKDRWDAYTRGLQWGVYSPNEIRGLEDDNPRDGGDIFYPPPNTAGNASGNSPDEGDRNDPPQDA